MPTSKSPNPGRSQNEQLYPRQFAQNLEIFFVTPQGQSPTQTTFSVKEAMRDDFPTPVGPQTKTSIFDSIIKLQMQNNTQRQLIQQALNGVGKLKISRKTAQLYTFRVNQFNMKVVERSQFRSKIQQSQNISILPQDDLFQFESCLDKKSRVLVVGGTGVGKSTLINNINLKSIAQSGNLVQGVTKSFQNYTLDNKEAQIIQIMDSPGVGSLSIPFYQYMKSLCTKSYGSQFSMIVYVWNGLSKRITKLDLCILNLLYYLFRPKAQNIFFCITHLDRLKQEIEDTKLYAQKMVKILNKRLQKSLTIDNVIFSSIQEPALIRSQFLKRLSNSKEKVKLHIPEVSKVKEIAQELL